MTEQRYYVYDPATERWHDAQSGATVEWHVWGDYRFSFDIRSDCSRFIVVRPRRLPPNGELVDGPKLIASGLIDECSHGGAPLAIFDGPPAEALPTLLPIVVVDAWTAMRDRLREDR